MPPIQNRVTRATRFGTEVMRNRFYADPKQSYPRNTTLDHPHPISYLADPKQSYPRNPYLQGIHGPSTVRVVPAFRGFALPIGFGGASIYGGCGGTGG